MPPTPGKEHRRFRVRLKDGTALGIVDEQRIRALIRRGVIEADDLIQRVGSATWRRADTVAPALFAAEVAAPIAMPPEFVVPAEGALQQGTSLRFPSPTGTAPSRSTRFLPVAIGGALLVLVVAAVVLTFILSRDNWEGTHRRELLALCQSITTELPAGQGASATEREARLDALLGDRELEDPDLQDAVVKARGAINAARGEQEIEQARSLANEGARLRSEHLFEEALRNVVSAKNALGMAASHGVKNPGLQAWIESAYTATKHDMESDPTYQARKEASRRAGEAVDRATGLLTDANAAIARGKLRQGEESLMAAVDALAGVPLDARGVDALRNGIDGARSRLDAARSAAEASSPRAVRSKALREEPAKSLGAYAECMRANLEVKESVPGTNVWYAVESADVVLDRVDDPDRPGKGALRGVLGTVIFMRRTSVPGARHRIILIVQADLEDGFWVFSNVDFLDPNEPKGTHAAAAQRDRSDGIAKRIREWAALCRD